ncbi:class I histocompatibility antigen, F10 alpha chain-like [Astyanax mexicanus]|uniref:Class I histocompatibility antigen, F10 alpha chain-like n=1 Tax=Astyanax mexicanus TaxID=7994 RepID=A0A8T2KVA1_ASTMX|nr:class I histocompatibility antigen, F10 alpha chain-like [Astyanax mexicanus]
MKNANLLFLLLYLQQVTTDLRYDNCCYWMVSKGYDLPEFTERRVLNEVTVYYHDSSLKSKMPCPDWINTTAGIYEWGQIQYWSNHNRFVGTLGLQSAINQFNLTGTLTDRNIYQGFGCCSLYPNGTYSAFLNHAFNGKDFTSFDINSKTFVAAVPQAVVYKTLRESDQTTINYVASYYQKTCLDRLKILKEAPRVRDKRVPDVRILEPKKNAGSVTVTCHVTGFYPREVQVIWLGKQNYSCVVLHISIPNNITKVWGMIKYSTLNITPVILFYILYCNSL